MMNGQVVSVDNLSKSLGAIEALKGLSFSVTAGEVVALLGPNGAGKSTCLQILQGLRSPSGGSVEVFGHRGGSDLGRRRTGVPPQNADFPPQLTPLEILRFAGNPDLVFLDEPTTGLDLEAQHGFRGVIRDYVGMGGSVVLTSHNWPEIEAVADRFVLIEEGSLVLEGRAGEITSAIGTSRVRFRCEKPCEWTRSNFTLEDENWSALVGNADETIRQLVGHQPDFHELSVTPLSLEEALPVYRAGLEG